jgi:hypothetical protein
MRKDARTLTAGQINRELDALEVAASKNCAAMIAAGRGDERPSETALKADTLALSFKAIAARRSELRIEIELRYGPSAPSRLPLRGFGPRKL